MLKRIDRYAVESNGPKILLGLVYVDQLEEILEFHRI